MKLHPYPALEKRRHKVFKHVFDHRERWWEVFGSLHRWHEQYTVLRGLGCFAEGWERAVGDDNGEATLDTTHDAWFAAAEQACNEALASRRVYASDKGRSCYVGDAGVTVYASTSRHLATCFRPSQCLGSRLSMEEVTERVDAWAKRKTGFAQRAAVRRADRRASLSAEGMRAFEGSEE